MENEKLHYQKLGLYDKKFNYYNKNEVNNALAGKVNVESGKGLSSNDFTNENKALLDDLKSALDTGKVLSDKNFTSADKTKLDGLTGVPSGGTTGQILKKNSNTDGDFSWDDAPTASDITYDNTKSGSSATNPQEAIDELYSKIGSSGGVAELDDNGKVPSSQLPSYVDDVIEYADAASFPGTGESGKIYVDLSTNKTYRWGGSSYVVTAGDLALGETASTAFRGDRGKIAYDDSQTNKTNIGNLTNLETTAKSDLVSAINEIKGEAGSSEFDSLTIAQINGVADEVFNPVLVTSIGINKEDSVSAGSGLTLTVGDTAQLVADILPINATNKTITWASSDTSKVTVTNTGIAAGNATITATANDGSGVSGTLAVTAEQEIIHPYYLRVQFPNDIEWLHDNGDYPVVRIGTPVQVSAEIEPSNATDKTVTWSIDDNSSEYATVTNDGNITALKSSFGSYNDNSVIITATSNDQEADVDNYTEFRTRNAYVAPTSIEVSGQSNVSVGQTITITAMINPLQTIHENVVFEWNTSNYNDSTDEYYDGYGSFGSEGVYIDGTYYTEFTPSSAGKIMILAKATVVREDGAFQTISSDEVTGSIILDIQ